MKKWNAYMRLLLAFTVGCFSFSACMPITLEATPLQENPAIAEETPNPKAFPYGLEIDYIKAYAPDLKKGTKLLPDASVQDWFADYVARAQIDICPTLDNVPSHSQLLLHYGEKTLTYAVWFDEETGMFDSALHEDTHQKCLMLPEQTDTPLMLEVNNKDGALILTVLPEGKLLQTYTWSVDGVNTNAQLRYTGNLEIWLNDKKHIIQKDYAHYGYEGLPYTSLFDPMPMLRYLRGRSLEEREPMLFLSHQTDTNGIGTWEEWRLYRIIDEELVELYIAPGHEDDLKTTVEVRGGDIFLVFPVLKQELLLADNDFSFFDEFTHKDALAMVERYKSTNELEEMFTLWEQPVYIEYAGYWADRGPSTDTITLWHGVNGPAHYYQGYIKVTYDITLEGLIPRRVKW